MRHVLAGAVALLGLGVLTSTSPVSAFPLRAPQVVFNPANLQGYMNLVDPGIDVSSYQLDAPTWSGAALDGNDFTLVLYGPPSAGDAVGIYNLAGGSPTFHEVLPASAVPGWYAAVHFGQGNLIVSRFDENSLFVGQTLYQGVDKDAFGFYAQGACGSWFSQDDLNQPPAPQALVYRSNSDPKYYWMCFEACAYAPTRSTFVGEILSIEPPWILPASHDSWGHVKGMYR